MYRAFSFWQFLIRAQRTIHAKMDMFYKQTVEHMNFVVLLYREQLQASVQSARRSVGIPSLSLRVTQGDRR